MLIMGAVAVGTASPALRSWRGVPISVIRPQLRLGPASQKTDTTHIRLGPFTAFTAQPLEQR